MSATLTTPREFAARSRAANECRKLGQRAQARGCARLAAKFYRAGSSVYRAAREAVDAITDAPKVSA